ncbi:hypothetical protein C2S51_035155 [Perilla frutescens var. frutescens]|nr:hypothetical protein C2S51_035155 [Perilla frutescens var. frutescens]
MAYLARDRAGGGGFSQSDLVIREVAVPVLTAAVCSVAMLLFFHGYEEVFGSHTFVFAGYLVALLLLSTGILVRAINPHVGFALQLLGISALLLYFCAVVGAFLSKPFFYLFSALIIIPFLYAVLIKPFNV